MSGKRPTQKDVFDVSWGRTITMVCACTFTLKVQTKLFTRVTQASAEFNDHPSLKCPNCGGDMKEQS